MVDFAVELSPAHGPFGSTLNVLRSLRLLRLYRLAHAWRSLQRIIATLMLSVTSAGYLTLLLLLFLFIDALLGMQLFGYRVGVGWEGGGATTHDLVSWHACLLKPRHEPVPMQACSCLSTACLWGRDWGRDLSWHAPPCLRSCNL